MRLRLLEIRRVLMTGSTRRRRRRGLWLLVNSRNSILNKLLVFLLVPTFFFLDEWRLFL
jgi:hypothetical protein